MVDFTVFSFVFVNEALAYIEDRLVHVGGSSVEEEMLSRTFSWGGGGVM